MADKGRHPEYDVVIVGSGVVGLSMALLLAEAGRSVALVGDQPPVAAWSPEGWDIRTSAITRFTETLWESLGVWPLIKEKRLASYENMSICDSEGFGSLSFLAADVGEPNLGHIVENKVLLSSLWERVQQLSSSSHSSSSLTLNNSSNITVLTLVAPQAVTITAEMVTLDYQNASQNAETLSASLLIGADGSRSWVREQVGIVCDRQSYSQAAVVTTVRTEKTHEFTAWQRFLPHGPLAFLPLSDPHCCSIVWTQALDEAAIWCQQPAAVQAADLLYASDHSFGEIQILNTPLSFPLTRLQAQHYVKPRVALIGDAAHVIHPLAGQGVNLGVIGAASLAKALASSQTLHQHDDGDYWRLRRYERAQRSEANKILSVVGSVNHVFQGSSSVARGVRSIGMQQIDRIKPLKRWLVKQALGKQGVSL